MSKCMLKNRFFLLSVEFVVLWLLFQIRYLYHFAYIEQYQLFLFGQDYLNKALQIPGGMAQYIGEFIVQFFYYPMIGAFVSVLLIVVIQGFFNETWNVLSRKASFYSFSLWVGLLLFLSVLDFNFLYKGVVCFLLLSMALYGYVFIRTVRCRLIYSLLSILFLYYMASPIHLLFFLSIAGLELGRFYGFKNDYPAYEQFGLKSFLSLIVVNAVSLFILYEVSNITSFRIFNSADGIYNPKLEAGFIQQLLWWSIPSLFLLYPILCRIARILQMRFGIFNGIQLLVVISLFFCFVGKYDDHTSLLSKKLDYYTVRSQWESVLEECKQTMVTDHNATSLAIQNMALANKGILADSLFHYPQNGSVGLVPEWGYAQYWAMLSSDICFLIGDMATARRYALEGNIHSSSVGYPRNLKRLVDINLMYGEYAIAEKYISYLEKTFYYAEWAKEKRLYLYNDNAVIYDEVLNKGRQRLAEKNHFFYTGDYLDELKFYSRAQSIKEPASQYLLCYYLLDKDIASFSGALASIDLNDSDFLPVSMEEAVIICAQNDVAVLSKYKVSKDGWTRFRKFVDWFKQQREIPLLPSILKTEEMLNYWFYYQID